MKTPAIIITVSAVAVVFLATLALAQTPPPAVPQTTGTAQVAVEALPRLVDLGAGRCIPCKMMKPILDELKRDYSSKFTTEFLDVWEKPEAAKPYRVQIIPTQIFFDASGKELFRHEGFLSKDEILAKWKELGVDLESTK